MNTKLNKCQKLRIGRLVVLFLFAIFVLSPLDGALAQSDEQHRAKLIEGAKKEGKAVWYAAMGGQDSDKLMKEFEKKYPFVKMECYRAGAEKILARVLEEARADRHIFDVTDNGILEGLTIKTKGIFGKYLSPERKYYSDVDKDPEGYWTGIYANKVVVMYNTKLVAPKDVPKTYEDLLDPKWKGKMGMDTKAYYELAVLMKIMGGGEKGLNFVRKLSEQNIQFRTGRTLVGTMVIAGEMSMGLFIYNHSIEEVKGKGAPVDWVALEPVIDKTHPFGVAARAPHPNAGRLFTDYVLSREGQEVIASFYRVPTRSDVEAMVPRLKVKDKKTFPPDASFVNDFEKYAKLYRTVLMKK